MKINRNEWQHSDDCLSIYPLDTGQGNWHCTCGYDAYKEALEDAESADALRAENARLRAAMKRIVAGSEYLIEIGVMKPDWIFADALKQAQSALAPAGKDGE